MHLPRRPVGIAALIVLASAPGALAAPGPIEFAADFTASTPSATMSANAERTGMYALAHTTAGQMATLGYCNPYGPNTEITGFRYSIARGRDVQPNIRFRERTTAGVLRDFSDWIVPGISEIWGPGPGQLSGVQCIALDVYATGTTSALSEWRTDLESVFVQDLQGPSFRSLHATQPWTTGDAAIVEFDSDDNLLRRGALVIEITGGGRVVRPDHNPVETRVAVPVGNLPDGLHTLVGRRDGNGWESAYITATVGIDRNGPTPPNLNATTFEWTNAEKISIEAAGSSDGSGSGVAGYEFQVDGGAWIRSASPWQFGGAGAHSIRGRAYDRAGLVSAPSDPIVVRIDRTRPTVLELDALPGEDGSLSARMRARDDGGSGIGACRAVMSLQSGDGARLWSSEFPSGSLTSRIDMPLNMANRSAGNYRLQLDICDEAGNRSSRVTAFTWRPASASAPAAVTPTRPNTSSTGTGSVGATPSGGSGTASGPSGPKDGGTRTSPSGATSSTPSVSTPSVSVRRPSGMRWTRPVRAVGRPGAVVRVRGTLLLAGRPLRQGVGVVVRDSRRRTVGVSTAGRGGRISLLVRIPRRGNLTIAMDGASTRAPIRVVRKGIR